MVRWTALTALGIAALMFLVWPLVRILGAGPSVAPAGAALPGGGALALPAVTGRTMLTGPRGHPRSTEEQAAIEGGAAAGELPAPEGLSPMTSEQETAARSGQLDHEILDLARENPKKVTLVLRSWLEG